MMAFHESLSNCSLQDLGYRGSDFNWSNWRENGALVWVRLDRCVANDAWISLFLRAQVFHAVVIAFDHMGLITDLNPPHAPSIGRKKRRFHFEHMWVREVGCEEAI